MTIVNEKNPLIRCLTLSKPNLYLVLKSELQETEEDHAKPVKERDLFCPCYFCKPDKGQGEENHNCGDAEPDCLAENVEKHPEIDLRGCWLPEHQPSHMLYVE